MLPYIAEFLGTMMLIILGDGVVANVNLNKSGMKGAGAVQITLAWGLAVLVPAFIFGEASGASFNPALTIALAVEGSFAWSMVPGYVIAQLAGAFVGASIVYLLFKGQFDATEDPGTKLGVFCTGPSIPNTGLNILSEAVGTFILVFAIKGIGISFQAFHITDKEAAQNVPAPVTTYALFRDGEFLTQGIQSDKKFLALAGIK